MIIREVDASAVADLALTPPRAALAATEDNEIYLLPINVNAAHGPQLLLREQAGMPHGVLSRIR